MFKEYRFFVIKNGDKVMAFTESKEVYWTDDLMKAHQFSDRQEVETYRREHLNDEFYKGTIVKPWIVLYFEL